MWLWLIVACGAGDPAVPAVSADPGEPAVSEGSASRTVPSDADPDAASRATGASVESKLESPESTRVTEGAASADAPIAREPAPVAVLSASGTNVTSELEPSILPSPAPPEPLLGPGSAPTPPPPSYSGIRAGVKVDPGSAPPDVVRTLMRYLGQVKYCYEASLKRDPSVQGSLSLQLTLRGGEPIQLAPVDTSLEDLLLEHCVARKAARWRYPEEVDGTWTVGWVFRPLPEEER